MLQLATFATVLAVATVGVQAKDKAVTTSLFMVGFDSESLVGSVIASDASATTFSVACAETKNCDLPTNFIFTQGTSTMHYDFTYSPTASDDPARTIDVGCVIKASNGLCSKSLEATLGSITSTAASATTTFTDGGSALGGYQTVTITAGNLVIPSSTAVSTTTKTTSSSTTAAPLTTLSAASSSATSTTSADEDFFEATKSIAIVASSTSNGGSMPMNTGNVGYIAGAAAMVALVAL
ncbi:hypothetical protein BJ878DRAFT_570712 [Calycina marina]|uniref:GPI anchored cell wall protein n=1 Tax=Calycina marina TaxID=1763456 RepID=A0A9P7YX12_9HELO|nr:hypothetical protein BJ878DRAFT_570712 [Calycina marina]